MRVVNKKFRKFTKIGMFGVVMCPVSKKENKVSAYAMKGEIDMYKDMCANWCNDPAEQGGIISKCSPTKLR